LVVRPIRELLLGIPEGWRAAEFAEPSFVNARALPGNIVVSISPVMMNTRTN
jgi:hypothetical protein